MSNVITRVWKSRADKRAKSLIIERVDRGIKLLDKKLGPTWPNQVRIDGLNLSSGWACIVGQAGPTILAVLGKNGFRTYRDRDQLAFIDRIPGRRSDNAADDSLDFDDSCDMLGLRTTTSRISHGFVTSNADRHGYWYDALQEEWEYRLRQLQIERNAVSV